MNFTPNIFILGSTLYSEEKPREAAYYAASQRLNIDELLFRYFVSGDKVFYIAASPDEFSGHTSKDSSPVFCVLEGHPGHRGDGVYVFKDEDNLIVVIKKGASYTSLKGSESECLNFIIDNTVTESFYIFIDDKNIDLFENSFFHEGVLERFPDASMSIESINAISNDESWEYLEYEELQKGYRIEKKVSLLIGILGMMLISASVALYVLSFSKEKNTFPSQVNTFTNKVKTVTEKAYSVDNFSKFVRFETELKSKVFELGGWVDYINLMSASEFNGKKNKKHKNEPLVLSWQVHVSSWATQEQIKELSLSKVTEEGDMLVGNGQEVWK